MVDLQSPWTCLSALLQVTFPSLVFVCSHRYQEYVNFSLDITEIMLKTAIYHNKQYNTINKLNLKATHCNVESYPDLSYMPYEYCAVVHCVVLYCNVLYLEKDKLEQGYTWLKMDIYLQNY